MSDLRNQTEFTPPPLPPLPTRHFDLTEMRARLREEWEENRRAAEEEEVVSWEDRPGVSGVKSPMFMMMALAAALAATAPQGGVSTGGAVAPIGVSTSL